MCKKCGNDCGNSCFKGVEIPRGPIGPRGSDGTGISSISWHGNTESQPQGTPGTTDIYTILLTNGSSYTFNVGNGATGPQGEQGTPGIDGTNGTNGVGIPGADGADGADGAAGVGVPGADGADGADGAKILYVTSAPSTGLGNDGDTAFDTVTSYPQMDVYQKVAGNWIAQGTFGNIVNPGSPTPSESSFLFKANKTAPQFLGPTGTPSVIIFEDDSTSPTYYDNGNVWNVYEHDSDQDVIGEVFEITNLSLTSTSGVSIDVTVIIEHQVPPASPVVKKTQVITVGAGATVVTPLIVSPSFDVANGDKVRITAETDNATSGVISVDSGVFFNRK